MAFGNPPTGDNETIKLYKWKDKSVSSVAVDDSETVFTFEAIASVTLINGSGLDSSNPTPDMFSADSTGNYTYNVYDSEWTTKTGKLKAYDCQIFFRKNGIDTPVDGESTSVTSVAEGTTYIEVTFAQAPEEVDADSVVLSYSYRDVTNPEPYEFDITEFNPKYNGRDFETIKVIGGKVYKRRNSAELTEISMTVLKGSNALSGLMLGERTVDTINSKTVRNTTGGNYVYPWTMILEVEDPDNSSNKLVGIYRNLGATSVDFKGGADANFEESLTLKCEPADTIELFIEG